MAKGTQNIVGIDIGSSKVGVLIGAPDGAGGIEVVGMGLAPNRGTRRGNIVNMEATVEALKQATEEAEDERRSSRRCGTAPRRSRPSTSPSTW